MKQTNTPQKQAINSQIEDIIDNKYSSIKKDLQRGVAFVDLASSIISNADIQDEDITDGDDDNGVDSVYIVSNEQGIFINIFNCKSSLKDDFSEKDLKEFFNGLDYLFAKPKKDYFQLENKKIVNKISEIREDKDNVLEVKCFYCVFNGKNREEVKILRTVKQIYSYFDKYFKTVYPKAKFSLELISANDLFSIDVARKETLRGKIIKLKYVGDRLISNEIEIINANGRLATVKGSEIAKLIETYGNCLFEKNVRGWMSFRKYNKDILNSCTSNKEADLFWFLNNGITIICENCLPDPEKHILKLTNPQIINGQQTAIVLDKALRDGKLRKEVKILLKIYETEDNDLLLKVAKSTNSQLAVKSRDLVSNNPEQKALQNEFKRKKYFYLKQRGEIRPKKASVKGIFDNFFVAQAVLSTALVSPSIAHKRQENILFGEPLYQKIFIRNFNEILVATLISDFCLKKRPIVERMDDKQEIEYFAYFHIARIMWEILFISQKKSFEDVIGIIERSDVKDLDRAYAASSKLLVNLLADYKKREEINSVGHFFARQEIDNEITKILKKK
ncbi:MAG: AIPR family protein [Candidatus Paceibacterota bacterium]